jgi:hypothetical protein
MMTMGWVRMMSVTTLAPNLARSYSHMTGVRVARQDVVQARVVFDQVHAGPVPRGPTPCARPGA